MGRGDGGGGLQESYRVKWCEEVQKKMKTAGKECGVLTTWKHPPSPDQSGYRSGPRDEPGPPQLRPSLTHFSLTHVEESGRSGAWSQRSQGRVKTKVRRACSRW